MRRVCVHVHASLCRLRFCCAFCCPLLLFLLPVAYVLFLLQVGGQDSPDVATSFNNIGNVYLAKGDLENALVQHQKALEIKTRVFGSEHLDVAKSYNNIGKIYNRQGKYEEALEMFTKSLDIKTHINGGDNHLDVAAS